MKFKPDILEVTHKIKKKNQQQQNLVMVMQKERKKKKSYFQSVWLNTETEHTHQTFAAIPRGHVRSLCVFTSSGPTFTVSCCLDQYWINRAADGPAELDHNTTTC